MNSDCLAVLVSRDSPPCIKVSHQPRKQKSTPLRNRENITLEPNIAIDDLHTPTYFGIMLGINQRPKRLALGILSLDLYRHNIVARAQKEIHLQRRIVTLVIEKPFTSFHKCLSHYVLEKTALPGAEVATNPGILLRVSVQHRHQKPRIVHVHLIKIALCMCSQWQFGEIEPIAQVDDSAACAADTAAANIAIVASLFI